MCFPLGKSTFGVHQRASSAKVVGNKLPLGEAAAAVVTGSRVKGGPGLKTLPGPSMESDGRKPQTLLAAV